MYIQAKMPRLAGKRKFNNTITKIKNTQDFKLQKNRKIQDWVQVLLPN